MLLLSWVHITKISMLVSSKKLLILVQFFAIIDWSMGMPFGRSITILFIYYFIVSQCHGLSPDSPCLSEALPLCPMKVQLAYHLYY